MSCRPSANAAKGKGSECGLSRRAKSQAEDGGSEFTVACPKCLGLGSSRSPLQNRVRRPVTFEQVEPRDEQALPDAEQRELDAVPSRLAVRHDAS